MLAVQTAWSHGLAGPIVSVLAASFAGLEQAPNRCADLWFL